MGDYNRNSRSDHRGGGRRSGGDFHRRDSGPRQMHRAVCDECGNNCEVPFRPSGDKPIYCSDCFERREGGRERRPSRDNRSRGGSGYERKDNSSKQLLDQMNLLNSKLDKILSVLESKAEKKAPAKKAETKKTEKKTEPKEMKAEVVKIAKEEPVAVTPEE